VSRIEKINAQIHIEVTPWLHVTPDFQIIEPSLKHIDKAYIGGVRVKIDI
jgi:porin